MTIINSIYKGKRYAILLTTILTFYAPVLFAQHIADSALVEVAYGQQPCLLYTSPSPRDS